MDRFEPLLQNASNKGGTWAEYHVDYQRVFDTAFKIKKGSEEIWSYTEDLLDKSVGEGILLKNVNDTTFNNNHVRLLQVNKNTFM